MEGGGAGGDLGEGGGSGGTMPGVDEKRAHRRLGIKRLPHLTRETLRIFLTSTRNSKEKKEVPPEGGGGGAAIKGTGAEEEEVIGSAEAVRGPWGRERGRG